VGRDCLIAILRNLIRNIIHCANRTVYLLNQYSVFKELMKKHSKSVL